MTLSNLKFFAALVALTGLFGFVLSRLQFETEDTILPGLAFTLGQVDYHVQAYVVILLLATVLFVFFVIPRIAADEGLWLRQLITIAFFFKVSISLFRLFWTWVEKGGADSALYFKSGVRLGPSVWDLDFSFVPGLADPGTSFTILYSVFIMSLTGPTLPGVFLVYALISFTAAILYYLAFRLIFPNGNRKLFAVLIFFYPSWVYWPSSVGKDAPMALFIALAIYGLAFVISRRNLGVGLVLVALGLALVSTIRPHIAGILGLAMVLPLVMTLPRGPRIIAPGIRILYVVGVAGLAWMLVTNASASLNLEDTSVDAAVQKYDNLYSRAERGGASFRPTPLTEPFGVPMAFVAFLFRPFPWEAPNAAAFVLSLEGAAFAVLMLLRLGVLRRAVTSMFSNPFLIFLIVYVVVWALSLTVVGNFSLLGRQRLMALPAVFMLLSFAPSYKAKKKAGLDQGGGPALSTTQETNRTLRRRHAG